jgi:Na+/phosphate symporter
MQNQDVHFTFKTSVVILSGANIGSTAHTEIIVASSGISGHVTFTIVFAPITNNCQQKGDWLLDISSF